MILLLLLRVSWNVAGEYMGGEGRTGVVGSDGDNGYSYASSLCACRSSRGDRCFGEPGGVGKMRRFKRCMAGLLGDLSDSKDRTSMLASSAGPGAGM
ncbi:hypothetical protein C8J57DRAFT_1402838 [Mycena rebaudengoi]|nr:hypothetical protein C8J57DRAFT_1402838 [Mycena rebaudengoi]